MDQQIASRLRADLFLRHASGVHDFCERDDMLFAYLSDRDSVNVTSPYEMYRIGRFSIKHQQATVQIRAFKPPTSPTLEGRNDPAVLCNGLLGSKDHSRGILPLTNGKSKR